MTARSILNQLLQSGQGLAADLGKAGQNHAGAANLKGLLSGATGGLVGAGALALLLSSKKARKVGGKAVKYGGVAALGALAYRAYSDWQANQAGAGQAGAAQAGAPAAVAAPQTLDRLPAPQAEQHSLAVLAAMIGAAKADGHVGEPERQQLETVLGQLSDSAQDRAWLAAELAKPLDIAAIAALSTSAEMASEMYLASLIVVDDVSFMERAYLDELARLLNLAPELQQHLRDQARQAELV